MNDLFTLLIIIAVIVSILNKLFGTQKRPASQQRPAPSREKPPWIPPWLEPEAPEPAETGATIEEQQRVEQQIADRKPVAVPPDQLSVKAPLEQPATVQTAPKVLAALDIDMTSQDEIRRGIVFAEILGPCRARKMLKGLK